MLTSLSPVSMASVCRRLTWSPSASESQHAPDSLGSLDFAQVPTSGVDLHRCRVLDSPLPHPHTFCHRPVSPPLGYPLLPDALESPATQHKTAAVIPASLPPSGPRVAPRLPVDNAPTMVCMASHGTSQMPFAFAFARSSHADYGPFRTRDNGG